MCLWLYPGHCYLVQVQCLTEAICCPAMLTSPVPHVYNILFLPYIHTAPLPFPHHCSFSAHPAHIHNLFTTHYALVNVLLWLLLHLYYIFQPATFCSPWNVYCLSSSQPERDYVLSQPHRAITAHLFSSAFLSSSSSNSLTVPLSSPLYFLFLDYLFCACPLMDTPPSAFIPPCCHSR